MESNTTNKTTFFLEYYMINRTNYITDALKSNIYYLSNNQGITLPHKNNPWTPSDRTRNYFCLECFTFTTNINYNLQGSIMNLRTKVIIIIISKFPDITSKELQKRIAILDIYLEKGNL